MTPVSFADFYAACRDRLTDAQLRTLDAGADYFAMKAGGYCGLRFYPQGLWVSIFVGGMLDVWELRERIELAPVVGFQCAPDSPTYKLALYYGAEIRDGGELYPDGKPVLECRIQTNATKRLQKAA